MSKETLINLIWKQVMNKYPNHDYKVTKSLDCGSNKFIMSEQNFANLMI
jgi:hypothetical protein